METVVIIGGGLAGLTAALCLSAKHHVTLLEASSRLGGQILTEHCDGFVIERGAEGFVARSEAVPQIAAELGMPPDSLIGQSVLASYGYRDGNLIALAPGEAAAFLGFQVPKDDLGKGIRTLRHGMGSLIDAFEDGLRQRPVELRTSTAISAVTTASPDGVSLRLENGETMMANALVVATNARNAAALLAPIVPEAEAIRDAPAMSSVTVELAFDREAIDHPLDGTGFVVATGEQQDGLRACTFTTSKFIDRAPPGHVSLRAFFRPTPQDLSDLDDAAWTERAHATIRRILPLEGEAWQSWVTRWDRALPVFNPAHKDAMQALEQALASHPIVLAGSAFHGSGIDAAVRSGMAAAQAVLDTSHP
ncbi:protoporphyrinogen/coproporphyrinogen oxidase [Candidatus Entotheonella palauensis]|uniref:protoporphyrinogen/coproporphyrinogen oxidase n=1 Tax=Candidatus Entotheonella palauensis TaxID=93172 RepID=UPI000B7D4D80|nr:FAD-dependent oxidoreductase [Candidatus Entotheonella palauensis]